MMMMMMMHLCYLMLCMTSKSSSTLPFVSAIYPVTQDSPQVAGAGHAGVGRPSKPPRGTGCYSHKKSRFRGGEEVGMDSGFDPNLEPTPNVPELVGSILVEHEQKANGVAKAHSRHAINRQKWVVVKSCRTKIYRWRVLASSRCYCLCVAVEYM